jgi:ABC-type multidrug transport system ATPase subunit
LAAADGDHVIARVEALDLTRAYRRRFALRKACFTMDSGTITAVIGHNGAGKTTAFNLMARRIKPTSGTVLFDGREATHAQEHRRACGFLSHHSFLYSALSARENLQLVADLYRLPDADARITDVLERIGLSSTGIRAVQVFSRGMVQRLALGRLLLVDPDVWLLDEPASGLDQGGRNWLSDEVRRLAGRGKILALSSHSRTLVSSLATHAVVLSKGRVVFSGPVADGDVERLFAEYIG